MRQGPVLRVSERRRYRPVVEPPVRFPFALALIVLFAFGASSAFPDWLVTREGDLIVTEGAWRVEGRQVFFIAGSANAATSVERGAETLPIRSMTEGTLYVLPLSEIDLPRSESETASRTVQSTSGEHSRVDPRARKAWRSSTPTIREQSEPGVFLEAREDWKESRHSRAPVELQVRIRGWSWDNYFRAPEDRPQDEVRAAASSARLTWRWKGERPWKSYLEIGEVRYEEFPPTTDYGAGLRLDGRRNFFDLSAWFSRNRRALDIGEEFEAADILRYRAIYSRRSKRWEWRIQGQYLEQEFDESSARDSHLYIARTGLLYRGFGRKFAPELGVAWRVRDSLSDSEDYRSQEPYLRLRFSPVRMLAFHLQLENLDREYDLAPKNPVYRQQLSQRRWSFWGQVLLTRRLAVNLTYSLIEGDSRRAGDTFSSHALSTGLTLKLGSTAVARRPPARKQTPPQQQRP